jgi:RNA polymerase sigma factor (TIGR02999 family)
MPTEGGHEITALLDAWKAGDQDAFARLSLVVYPELARIARRHLKGERPNRTMHPSSLIQEAFVRLLPENEKGFQSRSHFFAFASQVMRHVLVDYARSRARVKRGALAEHVTPDASSLPSNEQLDEVVTIDLALSRLEREDARKANVFELRFFGGFSVEEAAVALNVSPITIIRDWRFACAWLRRELAQNSKDANKPSQVNLTASSMKP